MVKLTRVFEATTFVILVLTWVFSDYIDANRPNHPTHIFTIQTVNHGQYVYISRLDHIIRISGWSAFFIMFVVCVVLEAWGQADRE
jgi:hypothetical protein